MLLISAVIIMAIAVILLLGSAYIFYKYIYTPYKLNVQELSFEDLLLVLNATINTHLELYEKDIFAYKGSITNANFENYYNTITKEIITALSPSFMIRISFFIKEDEIIAIICRKVKEYLTEKVNGTV